MFGVRKRVAGKSGETRRGLLRVRFDVDGNALRYHRPFSGFVDLVEPAGEDFSAAPHSEATNSVASSCDGIPASAAPSRLLDLIVGFDGAS